MNVSGTEIDVFEYIFKGLITIIVIGIGGWCAYIMTQITKCKNDTDRLENMVKAHELEDARIYVGKTDFKETVVELKETVKRIYEKMDDLMMAVNNKKN